VVQILHERKTTMTNKQFMHHDYRDPNLKPAEIVLCQKIFFGKNSNLVRFQPLDPTPANLKKFLAQIHKEFSIMPKKNVSGNADRGKTVDILA